MQIGKVRIYTTMDMVIPCTCIIPICTQLDILLPHIIQCGVTVQRIQLRQIAFEANSTLREEIEDVRYRQRDPLRRLQPAEATVTESTCEIAKTNLVGPTPTR